MSLINQMLKDLDSRRGPAEGAQLAALQGMGLSGVNQLQWQNAFPLAAWLIVGALVLFMLIQSSSLWFGKVEPAVMPPAQRQTTAHKIRPEPDAMAAIDATAIETVQQKVDSRPTPAPASREPVVHDAVIEPVATARVDAATADTERRSVASLTQTLPAQQQTLDKAVSTRIVMLTPEQQTSRLLADVQRALNAQQVQHAERLLRKLLESYPSHIMARTRLAAVLVKQGRVVEGEQLLAEGLLIEPNKLELVRPYARLLAARGEIFPALEMLDRAIDRQQPDAESLALRAAILYRMKKHGDSVAAYRQALREQPGQAMWWTGLAVALEHDQQPLQALQAYRRASDLPLEKPVRAYVQQRIQALSNSATLY